MREIELLAPAGSYECLLAALKSGADAVYVGGELFGARAFAGNFSDDELKSAIDLVHLHGKKLFLTINTLLKEKELNSKLYNYLNPFYIHGLDAVIVQDMGVLMFVKKNFPDLPIHASTQMTVTSSKGLKFLKELGVERVVTSRELSLDEVKEITSSTNLEVESFVHGALCYAYSGQCIYSSLIGGRSGNRGQCAQPCRLPYKVNGKTGHFMSLKDICTLEHIDKLIESGVYSFKIEGRMKKPEYVASVTAMYRKYIDIYKKNGNLKVSTADMDSLKDVFSRGEFSTGYWLQKNGPQMVTFDKPSHTGVAILKVLNQRGNSLQVEVLKPLNKGDVIDIIGTGDNYTFGKDYQTGEIFEFTIRKGIKVAPDSILCRIRNNKLLEEIEACLDDNKMQQVIRGKGIFNIGQSSELHLSLGHTNVKVLGDIVEEAKNQCATKEQVEKQLSKMGTSAFLWEELQIDLEEGCFLPVQQLKNLRRNGVKALEEEIISKYRRVNEVIGATFTESNKNENIVTKDRGASLLISTVEQFEEINKDYGFDRIYIEYELVNSISGEKLINLQKKTNGELFLALPHILRQKYLPDFLELMNKTETYPFSGVLVRNVEEYSFLREMNYKGKIILDHMIHICNKESYEFWKNEGVLAMSYSPEFTRVEMGHIGGDLMELTVYGYATMMISAQCIKKTTSACTHKTDIVKLNDRKEVDFSAKNCCQYCYNLIYNYQATCLYEENEGIKHINPDWIRVNLTIEGADETRNVLKQWLQYQSGGKLNITGSTLGNFRRGMK